MSSRRHDYNHELTRKNYALSAGHDYGQSAIKVVVVLACVLLLIVGYRFFENHLAPASFLSDVRAENHELREALGKVRFDLEVELATRSELERQVAALNEQLKQTRDELAFVKSAGARATAR